jgi:lysine N6-hydroxylase
MVARARRAASGGTLRRGGGDLPSDRVDFERVGDLRTNGFYRTRRRNGRHATAEIEPLLNSRDRSERRHYDCVGVGVGPANLSLASLLHSHREVSNLFIERNDAFGWHDDQQIPGASLQVSPLKDLVTLADPTNAFSFLSYLHAQGRIYHFINARFDAVPRQEFRNYLEWASRGNENIVFGEEVRSIEFDGTFAIGTSRRVVTADNVAIGVGTRPWVPPLALGGLGETQFHVNEFVSRARRLGGRRVAVVGGGQSGAEAFLDLLSRPDGELPARVSWISRRGNFFPIDDSPFTNDYYMPSYSDYFYRLERMAREPLNVAHILTSDGISEATVRAIYQRIYTHRFIRGLEHLVSLHPSHEVVGVTPGGMGGWDLTLTNAHRPEARPRLEADVIVWATGFRPARMDFLEPIAHRLEREGGEYRIDEDFAMRWDGPADRRIFVLNAARQQRGLADMNLSLIAWRSQRIVDRLRGVRSREQLPSFIDWSMERQASETSGARRG